jgi:hypothetical protein
MNNKFEEFIKQPQFQIVFHDVLVSSLIKQNKNKYIAFIYLQCSLKHLSSISFDFKDDIKTVIKLF